MKITKARLKQMIREELEKFAEDNVLEEVDESVRIGRRPLRQTDRPPSDDIDNYDPQQIKLRRDFKEIGLDLPHNPSEEEKRFLIRRIHTKLRRNADAETVDKLRDLKFRLNNLDTVTDKERRRFFHQQRMKYRMNEELTRQDKTDIKKMVQDELDKILKKRETKQEMSEIVKKIMKKLYKDLSIEHSYIIDRIKI